MLKVFLVEDEVIVREGIKKKVRWEEYGFEFAGEASDGELAYPQIQKIKPDVVITDIRMPFMDGLELSRLIKGEMPEVKLIILSGYDEFQYAKDAIRIGVTEYLLKPVSRSKIIEAILRVKKMIEEEQEQKDYLQQFQKDMGEQELLKRKRFFECLVSKRQPLSELLDQAKQLGLELLAGGYTILLFKFYLRDNFGDAYSEQLVRLQQRVEDRFSGTGDTILFKRDVDGYALLVKEGAKRSVEDIAREAAQIVTAILENESELEYFIGGGIPVQRLQELPRAFQTASRAFACRYLLGESRAVFFGEMEELFGIRGKLPLSVEQSLSLKSIDTAKIDRQAVSRFLKGGTRESTAHFVEDYLESWGEGSIRSMLFRQYIVMDVHLVTAGFLEEQGTDKAAFIEQCGDIDRLAEPLATLEGTQLHLIRVLDTALALRDEASDRRYGPLLQEAREYIRKNFGNEDISLNQVARTVNISPAYFSSIFSKETGQTFIEYLTGVRMEKAKELLRCSGMKSSEIAYAVGYKDPHYFSYLFKKFTGCTAKEFRAGRTTEE